MGGSVTTPAFQLNAFQPDAFQTLVVEGFIYVVDSDDSCLITGTVTGGDNPDLAGHDGFTPEEIRRAKALDKKLAEQQRKLNEAIKQQNADRKSAIRDLVDPRPVAKVKKTKVESKPKVKADIPSVDTQALERSISNLEAQKNNILRTVAYRQEAQRLKEYLDYLEAQRLAELDDEETLLALL